MDVGRHVHRAGGDNARDIHSCIACGKSPIGVCTPSNQDRWIKCPCKVLGMYHFTKSTNDVPDLIPAPRSRIRALPQRPSSEKLAAVERKV